MASFDRSGPTFNSGTPVLRFNFNKISDVRWILWPVFAWRVIAPIPKHLPLNLFQRSVLGLTQARVTQIDQIAERLLLARELVQLIVRELQGQRLLDFKNQPTQHGQRLLEDQDDPSLTEIKVGHVFSDAFSGQLWPRFLLGDLPIADTEIDGDRIALLSGSVGDPWRDHTFHVRPADHLLQITQPSPEEILRAARNHRRQLRGSDANDGPDAPLLKRISFTDERPQPYLLALRTRRHESGGWMIDDPLVKDESRALRPWVEAQLDSYNGLRKWISPFVEQQSEQPTLDELQEKAIWQIEGHLTLAIRQNKPLYELLLAMQRALLEAQQPDAPSDKWDDVLLKAQKALEHLFWMRARDLQGGSRPLFEKLTQSDKEFNRARLQQIAQRLGFNTPLPETLSSVRRGKVQFAEESGRGSLRPFVVLTLLAAELDEAHPFQQVGQEEPDLLHRLDALASARDRAGHSTVNAQSRGTHPDTDQMRRDTEGHIETVYKIANILLIQDHRGI